MDFPVLLPTVRPNTTMVTYGGLGQWSSVVAAGITAGVALTTTYFGWRANRDTQTRARHDEERAVAAQLEAAKAAQAQQAAAAQTAAVQLATSGAQASGGAGLALPAGVAGMLGSPIVLVGAVGVALVVALALRGRR